MRALTDHLVRLRQRLLAIAVFLGTWEVAVRAGLLYPTPVPPASTALLALNDLLQSEEYFQDTCSSLQRMLLGYAIASVVAVPLGFLLGWSQTAESYAYPLLRALRQLPVVALFPVFILFFGLGEVPCVMVLTLAALWSILLSTMSGVQSVDPSLVKAARALGTTQLGVLRHVVLPATIPWIITGMRCAYFEVMLVLIPVEAMGVSTGWGIGVSSHEHHGQNHVLMYAILISIAAAGLFIDYVFVELGRGLCGWNESADVAPRPVVI